MPYYMASTEDRPVGYIFPIRTAPSEGHLRRIQDPRRKRAEEIFEDARKPHEQSRDTAYYACTSVENCARFMQSLTNKRIYYYEVTMDNPTRAAMKLVHYAEPLVDDVNVMQEIADEYWRQPRREWDFYEYLAATCTIVAVVDPPDPRDVQGVDLLTGADLTRALELWPRQLRK